MLPVKPPQTFHLPKSHIEGVDEDVIETIASPNSNHFLLITKTRLFVYQAKPFGPVACHERTQESIELFGCNAGLRDNLPSGSHVEGLLREQYCEPITDEKMYFYVMTENNFLLVYEVYTRTSEGVVYKDYGIPLNIQEGGYSARSVVEDDTDDEVLTVFAINESHKVIQNGYTISKQKGFLQFIRNDEVVEELPIRRAELRLHVVLKFDHNIIDCIGIIAHDKNGANQTSEYLLVLFEHGLQVLKLEDFKLVENKLIHILDGKRLIYYSGEVLVISSNATSEKRSINHILFDKESVESQEVALKNGSNKFTCSTLFDQSLVLVFENIMVYYDIVDRQLTGDLVGDSQIQKIICLSADSMLLLTDNNSVVFTSKWGNILQSIYIDENQFKLINCSAMDMKLLICGSDGKIQFWDLWKKLSSSLSNFRTSKVFTLINDNNDILLYSPMSESNNTSSFQTIKLPTKTVNNNITICKVNGLLTLLVVYVANKEILLINFLNSNKWISFSQLNIKGIDWLGDDYLMCHLIDEENDTEYIKCYHFPLLNHDSTELESFKIWEWEVPQGTKLNGFYVNTLSTFKMLKFTDESKEDSEDTSRKLFVTSEIIMDLSNSQIVIFDALSSIHPTGVNLVQKFHQFGTHQFPEKSLGRLKWIHKYKDGFIAWIGDRLVIIVQQEDKEWRFIVAYDRVEQIIEIYEDNLVIVSGNEVLLYGFEHIWTVDEPLITTPVIEEEYPISISLDTATLHNISSVTTQKLSKISMSHSVYLDMILDRNLKLGVDFNKIDEKYRDLKHYKFCLEKILSNKILEHQSLDSILQLIDTYDKNSGGVSNVVGKLEIVGNCLRKIETKHWNYLFENLKLTPRDLITKCIELSEGKILGTMLMVFLNYDEGETNDKDDKIVHDKKKTDSKPKTKGNKKKGNKKDSNAKHKNNTKNQDSNAVSESNDSSVSTVLKDETIIAQVLKIFVSTATLSTSKEQAQEFWDFALQLVRFLRALDSKGDTNLAQTCLDMI